MWISQHREFTVSHQIRLSRTTTIAGSPSWTNSAMRTPYVYGTTPSRFSLSCPTSRVAGLHRYWFEASTWAAGDLARSTVNARCATGGTPMATRRVLVCTECNHIELKLVSAHSTLDSLRLRYKLGLDAITLGMNAGHSSAPRSTVRWCLCACQSLVRSSLSTLVMGLFTQVV